MSSKSILVVVIVLCCFVATSFATTASFQGLGDFVGGSTDSGARGISDDGTTAVGYGWSESGREAFRWTQSGDMEGLGDLPGGDFYSYAYSASADGSVVVGWSRSEFASSDYRRCCFAGPRSADLSRWISLGILRGCDEHE